MAAASSPAEGGGAPFEITKYNYGSRLEELIRLIETSDFVAIDCTVETTGFLLQDETFNSAYMSDVQDWSGSWYDKIKSKEKSRCLVEVGVAVFKRVQPKEVEVEVFNIPVLPACIDDNEIARFRGRTSVRIQFDGYGKDFIKNVTFDMNKVFYMATPYLNRQLQEEADAYMIKNPDFMIVNRKRRLNPHLMPEIFEKVTEKERKSIIDRLKGASRVFEALSQHEIPIVGHHLLLKLIFIYKDFIEYLPDTFAECIDQINKLFKVVYDTKQIAYDLLHTFNASISSVILEQLKNSDGLKLYELIRSLNPVDKLGGKFTLRISTRSEDLMEDLADLHKGENVEEESTGFCYVAGFDALACGGLFLDLIGIMETAGLNCGNGQGSLDPDYLQLFLKGRATRFINKPYLAPEIPDRQSKHFHEKMKEKKNLWQQKRKAEAKEKEDKLQKQIVTIKNYAIPS